jgi:uncharacterized repeat protein (TIGR01451 family)/fimbrial isopeptide formation D2 family protein
MSALPRPLKSTILAALIALAGVLLLAAVARAEGSPNIGLTVTTQGTVLYGANSTVTLTAGNPTGQPYGYNLGYRAVLPEGISLLEGSASSGGVAIAPLTIHNQPEKGKTTLIWPNVSDLSPEAQNVLSFKVSQAPEHFSIGSNFSISAGAYINSQARTVPRFSATGAAEASSYTGSATASGSTRITAIQIGQSEGSPEGEILRGVHDHQTTYKLTVTNSSINKTTGVVVEDWLPAGLEYLGCGGAGADHTGNAPTNPGSSEEYPGSGAIVVPEVGGCLTPSGVETLSADPDGGEELPTAVYTHVSWSLGTLEAGQTRTIEFRAAVPLRENTTKWSGAVPSVAGGKQAANLDNNSGPETTDGQRLTTFAAASGRFAGVTAVSAGEHLTRTAKDLTTEKSASSSSLAEGQLTQWTILVHSSEYRFNTAATVTDTVPNGLCPLSSTNLTESAECEPHGAGEDPSSPYLSAGEEVNGTWKLVWSSETDAALAEIPANATTTITYDTRTRTHYQSAHAPSTPLLSDDSVTNTVLAQATTNVVCDGDGNCSEGSSTRIDHERPLGETVSDGSSATQKAAGPTIAKAVAEAGTECTGDHYVETIPVFHPGDQVCWRLTAVFPTTIDTKGLAVMDFLPAANTFDAAFNGSEGQARLAGDTLAGTTFNHAAASSTEAGGSIAWTLPEGGYVGREGQRFERVYATNAMLPKGATPGVLQGNLMKFANVNTPGQPFPYRAEAGYALQFPQLTLAKQIVELEGKAVAATTLATVKGGEEVGFALTISNAGEQAAAGVEVWDQLPAGLSCKDIVSVSAKGLCAGEKVMWGETGLGEEEVTVGASGTKELRFTVKVPVVDPVDTLEDHAGVVKYESATNTGGTFLYVPSENIDATPPAEPNSVAANAHAALKTEDVTFKKTHTSKVVETGNSAEQATVGEQVTFEVSATVPAGTTLSGTARLADPGIPSERLAYTPGTAEVKVNGEPAPNTFKVEEVAGSLVVVFPANYTAGAANSKVSLVFPVTVANVASNVHGTSISNSGKLTWTDPLNGAQTREGSDSVPLVEPAISMTETNNAGGKPIHGKQVVEYKLKPKDGAAASSAFNTRVIDTIPAGLTPSNSEGVPLAEGESTASGGVWSAKEMTLTWEVGTLAPSAERTLAYFVVVTESPVATAKLTDNAVATTASLEGEATGKRTAGNDPIKGSAGYEAKTENTLEVEGPTIAKRSDSAKATIGHRITYTVEVTLPAHVVAYDTTVIDTLPDSLDFDEYVSAECTSGCPPAVGLSTYTPKVVAANTTVAWYLGDLETAPTARTIKLVYRADVRATHRNGGAKIAAGAEIANSAALYYDKSHKRGFEEGTIPSAAGFEAKNGPATSRSAVVEPAVTLTKQAAVNAGAYSAGPVTVTDGDTVHYRLKVANTGGVAAYGIELKDVVPATLTAVTATTNSSDVTQTWSAGKPELRWKLKEVAPNSSETVELGYEAKLVPVTSLSRGQTFSNSASVSTPYFGVPEAERGEALKNNAGEAIGYREYAGPSAAVEAKVALPTLTVEKTTGASGFPTSANAEVNQSFGWRVVVKNTSTVAAKHLDVKDTLPPNWEYVGGASFAPGGAAAPTQSGSLETGRELNWNTAIELAAGASTTLTYQARPTLAAETQPGIGKEHPQINSASATVLDAAGNAEDAKGPFAAGPSQAQGILVVPILEVAKTPAKASVAAGEADSYKIRIHNAGTGSAREVLVADTLPKGMAYTAKTATASPSTGFSEIAASGSAASWSIASLAAGATVEITVPVGTEATLSSGSELTNNVAVSATEEPTSVKASGTIAITTSADVSAEKTVLGKGAAVPGRELAYEVSATNHGPSLAREVKLVDTLPAGVSYVSSSPECAHAGASVTCSTGNLAVGQKLSFQIVTHLAASLAKPFRNVVLAESPTHDPEPKNNEAFVETTPHPVADVGLEKVALTPEVNDGGEASFRLTATNHGPSNAGEAKILDTLPAGLSYVSASGAVCTAKGQEVTCPLGELAAGASASVELKVKAGTPGKRLNKATASSAAEDPEPGNNEASAEVQVAPTADLQITNTASPSPVNVGHEVTYTLGVHNAGPDPAKGTVVSDELPAGESYVSNDAGCTISGQLLRCELHELANAASKTIHVVVRMTTLLTEHTVKNTAAVAGEEFDPNEANNSASAEAQVVSAADVRIEQTASPTVADVGAAVTYSLTVSNAGPDPAKAVLATDELPVGESYVSNNAGCTVSGQSVRCELGELANGASRKIQIAARVGMSLAASTVSNSARASSTTFDPEEANNAATAEVEVAPAADLRLTNTASVTDVKMGGEVTYALGVDNAGPDAAKHVIVSDQLPAGETYLSDDGGCTVSGQKLSCELHEIASAGTSTVHVVVRIGASLGGTTVTNTAEVTSETFDPKAADNSAHAEGQVETSADLELVKTASPAAVNPNGEVTYALAVTDKGPDSAHAVLVEDQLPAGEIYLSNDAGCSVSGQKLACELGELANGATRTIHIVVRVGLSLAASTVANAATVTSTTWDFEPANNESTAKVAVAAAADLRLTTSVPAGVVQLPGEATYTLTAANAGPDAATGARLSDELPPGEEYVSDDGGCKASGRTVTCPLGAMGLGETRTIHLAVRVGVSLGEREVLDTARLSSETYDPEAANNSASAGLHTGPAADLALEESGPASALSGSAITWSLKVRNNGPSTAHEVTVEDPLPSGVTLTNATASQGAACRVLGGMLSCDLGTVDDGAQAEVTVTAAVTAASGSLLDSARVLGAEPDPDPANNSASATTAVSTPVSPVASPSSQPSQPSTPSQTSTPQDPPAAGGNVEASTSSRSRTHVRLRKLVDRRVAVAGEHLTYRLILSDVGRKTALGLKLCDAIPSETTVMSLGGGQLVAGHICFHMSTLKRGRSRVYTIVLRADANTTGVIVNTATLRGANFATVHAHAWTLVHSRAAAHRERGVTG